MVGVWHMDMKIEVMQDLHHYVLEDMARRYIKVHQQKELQAEQSSLLQRILDHRLEGILLLGNNWR